ncbi:MAG: flagellar basal body rod protein FlgC [Planctomycetaceae bacterium]|nr:MAG: flagellar basal body rod protein FlgC [Planctomycetaceae bacterium]
MNLLSGMDISASGLSAERQRMDVVANNIANANTTRTEAGGPYRRQHLVFAAVLDAQQGRFSRSSDPLGGVRVVAMEEDPSELPRVFNPGHPDADEEGFVTMPNVKIPNEMVDLMTASRAYEANLKALKSLRAMAEQTLSLLRGGP